MTNPLYKIEWEKFTINILPEERHAIRVLAASRDMASSLLVREWINAKLEEAKNAQQNP